MKENGYLEISLNKVVGQEVNRVLEQIRAEIKEQYGGCGLINDGLDMALSIIDKHLSESEG